MWCSCREPFQNRPRGHGQRVRLRRPAVQLYERSRRPRLRPRNNAVGQLIHAQDFTMGRRPDHILFSGIRVREVGGYILDWQLAHATEEERRLSRAAARKIRPCIRPDGRPILHNQGTTDYLQQGPAGERRAAARPYQDRCGQHADCHRRTVDTDDPPGQDARGAGARNVGDRVCRLPGQEGRPIPRRPPHLRPRGAAGGAEQRAHG